LFATDPPPHTKVCICHWSSYKRASLAGWLNVLHNIIYLTLNKCVYQPHVLRDYNIQHDNGWYFSYIIIIWGARNSFEKCIFFFYFFFLFFFFYTKSRTVIRRSFGVNVINGISSSLKQMKIIPEGSQKKLLDCSSFQQ
jgi:hypothetical protein